MTQKTNISLAKKGMNRSSYPSQLNEQEYTFAMNSNLEDLSGETYSLTNEHSNVLASKFKQGFKVVGFKNDINLNKTFFFLTNEDTKISEFGYITSNRNVQNLPDTEIQCSTCDYKNILAEPLENTVQVEHQEYITLLSDCVDNLCFNFSTKHPIKKIEIKTEKLSSIIVFTDNYNPPRYIQLDSLEIYSYEGEIVCSDESNIRPTCLACDKLKIFKDFSIPEIIPESLIIGGRLRMGTYRFLIAYSDELGQEISEYYSLTNRIDVFDENNSTLLQENLADRTNLSIKLRVEGLDKNYSHYKIAVIQVADINNATTYFFEGVHPINDNIVVYSTEENKERTSLANLTKQHLFVKKWEGLTQSNNYLFGYGIEVEKEMNLQPVVSLIGQFLKWQTHLATEDLYKNGVSNSLYLGYNRDEVVPFGIRFYTENGYKTSILPFVGRLPEQSDLEVVPANNIDRMSIESTLTNCTTSERNKKWQFYNTATVEGTCASDVNIPTIEVEEDITKICYVDNVAESGASIFTVKLTDPFSNLTDFIEDNRDACSLDETTYPFCSYLDPSQYTQTCVDNLFGSNCDSITLLSEEIEVSSVAGDGENGQESVVSKEKIFPEEYIKLPSPDFCNLYKTDTATGQPLADTDFETKYSSGSVFFRNYTFTNEECAYSSEIFNTTIGLTPSQGFYNNYFGSSTLAGLQTIKNSLCTTTEFTNKIHKGALWFRGLVQERKSFILEISKQNKVSPTDQISVGQNVRVSIFNKCNDLNAVFCKIISLDVGKQWKITEESNIWSITDGVTSETFTNPITGGDFYVSIDNPIVVDTNDASEVVYRTAPTDGCFSVVTRDIEYSEVTVSYTNIIFRKKSVYKASCKYDQPIIQQCKALPFEYGKFGYYESEENYPDNEELYNSQRLKINRNDLPSSIRAEFEDKFVSGISSSNDYTLRSNTNLVCKPIRHFRFPDNKVTNFMYENEQAPFNQSAIYPLGVTIDENIINAFLDIATKNSLITQEQRDSIVKYEIVRGDISNDRSVQASGLLYDTRTYKEKDREILYSNYPFNDLGADKMNLDTTREEIKSNNRFTFHSPETDYYKSTLPTEMTVQGYMFGKSKGVIDEVKEHPKYVILSSKAKDTANLLAGLEIAAEVAARVAQTLAATGQSYQIGAGFVVIVNPGGIGVSIAAYASDAIATVAKSVVDFGRIRYEWLKIFRDLGQPQNFAYYYYAEGNYNYLKSLQKDGQYIRGLNIAKKLKSNKGVVINESTGTRLTINNIDREESVFLSTGDYPIVYEDEYKNYDNNVKDFNNSSITYASENLECIQGKSSDIIRNIASPYVALKNYINSQYGTINSIRWISTGYVGDLKNPTSSCLPIFGGDTFISRHTLKRKMPQFLTDAMGQASLTPFNYSYYNNIGKEPKFYLDFELNKDFSKGSALFPDIDSDYVFDCKQQNKNYIVPPSKFYLYYYGIPNFLCESRINTNYRYSEKELSRSFYPDVGDIGDWTQQATVPLKTKNYFFYNNNYSSAGLSLNFRTLPDGYSKEVYDTAYDRPNGVMYSLPDNEENQLNEPWLIYRPLDFYEFPTSYGKLKDLRGIEGAQVLGRFENQTAIFNSVDVTVETGQDISGQVLGNGGIFARRPVTFSQTDLGYMGSQTSEMVSSEFGHFFTDAKRGYVFKVDAGGKGMEEISSISDGAPSGMSQWFKEHLPFKVLDSGIEGIDTDNALNGIGITMGWDSRFKRVFLTKKDFIVTNKECLKYDKEIGFYTDCGADTITCDEGYIYNPITQLCEREVISVPLCPVGYIYDNVNKTCRLIEVEPANCSCIVDVIANPSSQDIISGETTGITLTSSTVGASFSWTVVQNGITGATSGTGNNISQTLISNGVTAGTATYTITPFFENCTPIPITVVVTVQPAINFDVVSTDWGTLTTASAWEAYFLTQGDTTVVNITNFSLVSGRVRFTVNTNMNSLIMDNKNIITVNIVNIPSLTGLILISNSIVVFDPIVALPNGLLNLSLQKNQIVTFNPTIPLPSGLKRLFLNSNDIVTFNPSLALPNGLQQLYLNNNKITVTSWNTETNWINLVGNNGVLESTNNIPALSIVGTNTESMLLAKGWTIIP